MFFLFQYSAASCRFPSEGGGVSLFVRPLAIVHTGDARTHVRGTRWTHVPPGSCMETSEIIRSSRRAFPRPGGHKTGPTKLQIASARGTTVGSTMVKLDGGRDWLLRQISKSRMECSVAVRGCWQEELQQVVGQDPGLPNRLCWSLSASPHF